MISLEKVPPEAVRFWVGLRDGHLELPWCLGCQAAIFYPRSHCPRCHRPLEQWRAAPWCGTVISATTLYRGADRSWQEEAPYGYALVAIPVGTPEPVVPVTFSVEEDLGADQAVELEPTMLNGRWLLRGRAR